MFFRILLYNKSKQPISFQLLAYIAI